MMEYERRAGTVLGFALGDSLGWPSLWQHAQQLPAWTRRLTREVMASADQHALTDAVSPFSLNVSPVPLRSGPGDATDWLAATLWSLRRGHTAIERWGWLHQQPELAGRLSALTTVDRWGTVADPALYGAHNPHAHDDSGACRAVALAVGGDSVDNVRAEAQLTNAEDGLAAAQLIFQALQEVSAASTPDSFLSKLSVPMVEPSRLAAQLQEMSQVNEADPFALAARLGDLTDAVYSYGSQAADSVPLALVMADRALHYGVPLSTAVAATASVHRQAATAPALCGALLGAALGVQAIAAPLVDRLRRPRGCSIAAAAEWDLLDLVADPTFATTEGVSS